MAAEIENFVEKLEALDLKKDDEDILENFSSTAQLNSDRIPQKPHIMVAEIERTVKGIEALDLKKDVEEIVENISSTTQLNSDRIPQTTHIMVAEIEALDLKKYEEKIVEKERSWSDLYSDLLSLIRSRLFAEDEFSFLSVCKSWKSVLPIRRFHLPIASSLGCRTPCLLFSYDNYSDTKIFHPLHNECCNMSFEFGLGPQVYAAKNDWLLLYELQHRLFFFNPFTEEKIELPKFPDADLHSLCFTSLPTSKNWQIVAGAIKSVEILPNGEIVLPDRKTLICSFKCGDENWSSFDYDIDFKFSFSSAVIHKGSCHFLDMNGNILIYNMEKRTALPYIASKHINTKKGQQYLLTDNAEKLMAVFVSADGCWIQTCQWNDHKKTWEEISSLGNKTLFVSRASSLCEEASERQTRNTIYFPRFVNDHCLFYSLSKKRYYTFASGSSYDSFYKSKKPLDATATWIKP